MSQRHKAGDIVRRREMSGFIVDAGGLWQICDDGSESWCPTDCGDPDCEEWATLWEVNANGTPTGRVACHVCDCEMTP